MFTFPVGFFGGSTGAGDPYWNNVVLYLPLTGTNGQTTFTDVSQYGHAITRNGNTVISTAQFPSLTGVGSSAYFDGNGDSLSVSSSAVFSLGTGDFTIEFWAYLNTIDNFDTIYIHGNNTGTIQLFFVGGKLRYNNNLVAAILDTVTIIPTGQWIHLAIVRYSGTARWYINGLLDSTATDLTNWPTPLAALTLGRDPVNSGRDINGYLSHLRQTKVARYTTNFTPPTAPFPIG